MDEAKLKLIHTLVSAPDWMGYDYDRWVRSEVKRIMDGERVSDRTTPGHEDKPRIPSLLGLLRLPRQQFLEIVGDDDNFQLDVLSLLSIESGERKRVEKALERERARSQGLEEALRKIERVYERTMPGPRDALRDRVLEITAAALGLPDEEGEWESTPKTVPSRRAFVDDITGEGTADG